jgi:hypothetical protein
MSGEKPKGVQKSLNTTEDSLNNIHDLGFKTHENSLKTDGKGVCSLGVQKLNKKEAKIRTPQGIVPEINGIKITEYDVQICKHLQDLSHIREIARRLSKPVSGIYYCIRRMEKANLLVAHTGAYNTKNYTISANLQDLLGYSEDKPSVAEITAHGMSFTFHILSGEQPISHLPKLYFLRNVGSAEKGIKIHILTPFRLSWLISRHYTHS